jgi:hypothetical protein
VQAVAGGPCDKKRHCAEEEKPHGGIVGSTRSVRRG